MCGEIGQNNKKKFKKNLLYLWVFSNFDFFFLSNVLSNYAENKINYEWIKLKFYFFFFFFLICDSLWATYFTLSLILM